MFLRSNQFTISIFIAIFLLCLLPGDEVPKIGQENLDKVLHTVLFALLSFCMMIGFSKQYTFYTLARNTTFWSLLICISYGVAIEFFQDLFLIDRHFEWLDIVADSAGTTIGVVSFLVIVQGKHKFH